jgi:ubiquinone/menaquinone biosynthesis C-methylase UbiE
VEKGKIDAATVRADFNDLLAVVHYTRAAHELGLWASERALIERFFPNPQTHLIEAGCGAGRVTLGLWSLGYRQLTAFDFAEELLDQACSLALERRARAITFLHADATNLSNCHLISDNCPESFAGGKAARLAECHLSSDTSQRPTEAMRAEKEVRRLEDRGFGGALFMFNGLMQIPGRENRRQALRELHRVCSPGAPLLFTTHDRDSSPTERALWRLEAVRWTRGEQDPRLVEFGDRYFSDEAGRTFMHLPDRPEILEDLAATGWLHAMDAMRTELAREHHAVRDFSDECRFWAAHRAP